MWLVSLVCLPTQHSHAKTTEAPPSLLKEAERLWKEGVTIARNKQYQKALSKFWASYRLVPNTSKYAKLRGVIHFFIGRTYHKIKKWLPARDHYRAYVKLQPKGRYRKNTERWLKIIFPHIKATITLQTTPTQANCTLTHPGGTWNGSPKQPITIEAGNIEVKCEADGYYPTKQSTKIKANASKRVALTLKAKPKIRYTPDVRWIGWSIGGAGVVAASIGGVFGGMAANERASADAYRREQSALGSENYLKTGMQAERMAMTANILFITGGALVATGVILHFVLAPRKIVVPAAHVLPQLNTWTTPSFQHTIN
tara:strand:+ start:558 stop:1496 length:939 start_codon:yes stop_codon:yes gene_type:complete